MNCNENSPSILGLGEGVGHQWKPPQGQKVACQRKRLRGARSTVRHENGDVTAR